MYVYGVPVGSAAVLPRPGDSGETSTGQLRWSIGIPRLVLDVRYASALQARGRSVWTATEVEGCFLSGLCLCQKAGRVTGFIRSVPPFVDCQADKVVLRISTSVSAQGGRGVNFSSAAGATFANLVSGSFCIGQTESSPRVGRGREL